MIYNSILTDFSSDDEKSLSDYQIIEKPKPIKNKKQVKFGTIDVIEIQSFKEDNQFRINFEEKNEQKVPRKDMNADIFINIQEYDNENEKTHCQCLVF